MATGKRQAGHRDFEKTYPSVAGQAPRLPAILRSLFWDQDYQKLTWERDADLITARVLASGGWHAVMWLREQMGDQALRQWLVRRQGAGLSPAQLRFWELVLELPHRQVNGWLAAPGRAIWDQRRHA